MASSSMRLSIWLHLFGLLWSLGHLEPAIGAPVEPLSYRLTVLPNPSYTRFEGRLTITFECSKVLEELVLESADLDVLSTTLHGVPTVHELNKPEQTLTILMEQPLSAGQHTVEIQYAGRIGVAGPGLYRARVTEGQPRGDLFSSLCCDGNVQYLMPVLGKAGKKASLALTLMIPADAEAVSVMPIERRTGTRDGWVEVEFRPTPPMSPDLFFFAVGNFERRSVTAGRTDVGTVLPPQLSRQSDYALAASRNAVDYIAEYLDRAFPLPKLDSVLLPGAPGGAFGTWGSIQYAARYFETGEGRSTDDELLITTAIVAHETAHQWFGNLVTPASREHRWLSEGLAVWLENNFVDDRYPDWQYWLRANAYRDAAMRLDAAGQTHPVAHGKHLRQAPDSEIIYDKSAQVLRMVEQFAGKASFRHALQEYLDGHAHGYATTGDFWSALEAASLEQEAAIGRAYTSQAGVPLVDVIQSTCNENTTTIRLRQRPFLLDAESHASLAWPIPVLIAGFGEHYFNETVVLSDREVSVHLEGCGPFKVNAGNIGYFRTRYDKESFTKLHRHFDELPVPDQVGLLYDQFALAEGGYASFVDYLDLVRRADVSSDPLLHLQWVRAVDALDGAYKGHDAGTAFRHAARRHLAALLDHWTWEATESESLNAASLRSELIATLGRLGDVKTVSEAQRRISDVDDNDGCLPASIREAMFKAAGTRLDMDSARAYRRRAAEPLHPARQRCYWLALAASDDKHVAGAVLRWLYSDPGIERHLQAEAALVLARNHAQLAFNYLRARPSLAETLGRSSYVKLLSDVAKASHDHGIGLQLVGFVDKRFPEEVSVARRAAKEIDISNAISRTRLPGSEVWSSFARRAITFE